MTNPLIEKWEELNKKKEEPKDPVDESLLEYLEFKKKEDKIRYLASIPQSEDKIRYLESFPQSTVSVTSPDSGYVTNTSNPIITYDLKTIRDYFLQVTDKVNNGTAHVTSAAMEMDSIGFFAAGKKITFEIYVYD